MLLRTAVTLMLFLLPAVRQAEALDHTRKLTQSIRRIWQMQQGLPNGTVNCVFQSGDRYLWLGTRAGLARFDGITFTPIRDVGGIPIDAMTVRAIAEGRDRALWIATDRDGLICLKAGTARQWKAPDELPSSSITCLHGDRQGVLWVGTDGGVVRIDGGRVEPVGQACLEGVTISALCEMPDGCIVGGGAGNRLAMFCGSACTTTTVTSLPESTVINALAAADDGTLWIGSSDGLVRKDDAVETRMTTHEGLSDNAVSCITLGAEGSVWAGTRDGFNRIRGDQIEPFRTKDGLSQSTVHSICEDHEGTLWVGTKLGLNQFIDRRTIPFTIAEGMPSDDSGPIVQTTDGEVWIGTRAAGLARFDGGHFHTLTTDDGLPSNAIRAMAAGADGTLWVGTDKGLCSVREARVGDAIGADRGLVGAVCCLAETSDRTLWVGTDAALTAWRDGARVSISGDDELLEQPVSAMTPVDNHAAVIAAGLHGFVRGERDQIRGLPTYPPVPTAVRSLFQDAHGWLYLGTRDHGLYVDDGRTLMHLSLRQGLYDDDILGIADDHGGRLWMACSKGVFSVGHESLARFAAGTEDAVETTPLSPLESLRTVECQGDVQPAVTTTRDGRVWFSTSRGVLVVDPNHWRRQLPPTDVVIEEVTVNGRTELPGRPLELPAGVANLAFRYTALSYTSPSRITFRYRLEGFDPEWIEAGTRREAFYTNLPPGRYRFRVAATNADDKRYEASAPVDITIPPSLSETAWFMPLCGGLAAFGAWSIYRWRMRQMKQRMQIVVAERSRIARELHDTLMQGFSGITMEMQALSSRLQNPSDRKELEGIIGDAGTCLREARESIAGLRGAHTGLAEAVRQAATQIAETRDFQLDLHVDLDGTRLSPQVEYHLLRITQEALANAAKHAHARRIAVTLGRRADQVRLIVRDDGVGLAGLADGPASTGHYGLIGMRERANQIGATFHLETQPDRGLAVCVTLPLVAGGTEAHAR